MTKENIQKFLKKSVAGELSVAEQLKFLENFTIEKVRADDFKIFVEFMQKQTTKKLNMPGCMDICGTGGSGLQRINTSTISAFILAGLGVKIAKHGNKAASGRFGSFDLLESLGINIEKSPEELEKIYHKTGLAFIFARNFHPAIKHFAEARKLINKPTIFNLLGPLLNPANPKIQIIGTSFRKQMRLIAEVCKMLGKKKVLVVRGCDGLDEVTLTGETEVVELNNGKIREYKIKPEDFGISRCVFAGISGGDGEKNREIAMRILSGETADKPSPTSKHADLVFVNVALALKLAGKAKDLKAGYEMAKNVIGLEKLEQYKGNILNQIAASKILRKSDRDFLAAISHKKTGAKNLIAEIKQFSPSEGQIYHPSHGGTGGKFSPAKIAKIYEESGASAISVLTDEKYFHGSFEFLREAKSATKNIPILCKDFILHEYQVYKAREYGADAILLIATLIDIAALKKLKSLAENLGMNALVEVHDEEDLKKALAADAKIIGINNRNLKTFKIDTATTNRLVKKIPHAKIIVSESGINDIADVKKLNWRVNAVLVGTSLMKSKNMANACKKLSGKH